MIGDTTWPPHPWTTDTAGRHARLRLGVAQIDTSLGDVHVNMAKHIEAVQAARAKGVELLVFAELSLTGYQVATRVLDLAMARDDPFLLQLSTQAPEMTIVVGFVEEGPAAQFYNAAAVLKAGQCAFVHRKLNLATYGELEEDKYFADGRYVDVVTHRPPWQLAVLVCADAWNPGLVHLAALYGATALAMPVASGEGVVGTDFSNPEGWAIACRFYALLYGMPVAMANHCGEEGRVRFWGGSRIVDPFGHELAVAGDGEGLITAEVDYGAVRRARFQLPTVRDSNLDLIHREVERLANRIGVPRGIRSS